jgi:hypothetical protein
MVFSPETRKDGEVDAMRRYATGGAAFISNKGVWIESRPSTT